MLRLSDAVEVRLSDAEVHRLFAIEWAKTLRRLVSLIARCAQIQSSTSAGRVSGGFGAEVPGIVTTLA